MNMDLDFSSDDNNNSNDGYPDITLEDVKYLASIESWADRVLNLDSNTELSSLYQPDPSPQSSFQEPTSSLPVSPEWIHIASSTNRIYTSKSSQMFVPFAYRLTKPYLFKCQVINQKGEAKDVDSKFTVLHPKKFERQQKGFEWKMLTVNLTSLVSQYTEKFSPCTIEIILQEPHTNNIFKFPFTAMIAKHGNAKARLEAFRELVFRDGSKKSFEQLNEWLCNFWQNLGYESALNKRSSDVPCPFSDFSNELPTMLDGKCINKTDKSRKINKDAIDATDFGDILGWLRWLLESISTFSTLYSKKVLWICSTETARRKIEEKHENETSTTKIMLIRFTSERCLAYVMDNTDKVHATGPQNTNLHQVLQALQDWNCLRLDGSLMPCRKLLDTVNWDTAYTKFGLQLDDLQDKKRRNSDRNNDPPPPTMEVEKGTNSMDLKCTGLVITWEGCVSYFAFRGIEETRMSYARQKNRWVGCQFPKNVRIDPGSISSEEIGSTRILSFRIK